MLGTAYAGHAMGMDGRVECGKGIVGCPQILVELQKLEAAEDGPQVGQELGAFVLQCTYAHVGRFGVPVWSGPGRRRDRVGLSAGRGGLGCSHPVGVAETGWGGGGSNPEIGILGYVAGCGVGMAVGSHIKICGGTCKCRC